MLGDIDCFFASVCESTKRLPCQLEIEIKQIVSKAVLSAEMKHELSLSGSWNPSPSPDRPR